MWVASLILAWLKWFFLALATGSMVIAGILLWHAEPIHRQTSREPPAREMTKIDKPLLVERKGDRLVWRLQAETARQLTDGNMEMDLPELDLFTRGGTKIPVRSRKAFVDTSKRTIRFQNEVIVDYNMWQLRGDLLIYDMNRDLILMPEEFQLTGPGFTSRGSDMTIDRNRQLLLVEKRVWIRDESAVNLPITP